MIRPTSATPAAPTPPPGLLGRVQRGGRARRGRRARRHAGSAGSAGSPTSEVLLAAALAVRAVRLGSVCVDLAAVHHTVLGEGDEPLDVSALPWPSPSEWLAACRAGPVVADGGSAPSGRPLRLVDGLLYLERFWGEEELVRRSLARAGGHTAAGRRSRAAAGGARCPLSRTRPPPGSGSPRRWACSGTSRCWRAVRAPGKTTTVARLLALLAEQPGPVPRDRAGRAHRQGRRPAAGGRARPSCPRARRPGWPTPPPCTGCWAGGAAARSATGAPSGCPTTSWWWTRRRWSRCR